VYFCGHSLGLQPKSAASYIRRVLESWHWEGVEAYFSERAHWVDYADRLRPKLAPLLGAQPESIAIAHTLTTNLHLLLASFYHPTPQRYIILTEQEPFPSDLYALQSAAALKGYPDAVRMVPELVPTTEAVLSAIDSYGERLAGVWMSGVHYLTGQVYDIQAITAAAHRVGAWAGWDLAHAVGNIPLQLDAWNVDFAVWCSYKYLNAGPGAVGGLYVAPRHWGKAPILAGWWGNRLETRFVMQPTFDPTPDARAWVHSNPSPLLLATLEASLDIFALLDLPTYFAQIQTYHKLLREKLSELPNLSILTPAHAHGAQVSFQVQESDGQALYRALLQAGYCIDWRRPGILRAAPVPLYNTPEEIDAFAQTLSHYLRAHA
jgi:kynureninase